MKIKISAALFSLIALTGCYEDKGNYTYSEIEEMTLTFPDNISAMEGSEDLEFNPVIVSSINGTIKDDDPRYSFGCKLNRTWYDKNGHTQYWVDIDSTSTKAVKYFAKLPAANYALWYTVTNNETGVTFNFRGNCSVISTTSEGWMVVSNNGADNKVRLDMIFTDSKGNDIVRKDLFDGNGPDIYGANYLIFSPSLYASVGDQILLTAESAGYMLNAATLQYTAGDNIKNSYFVNPNTNGEVVNYLPIYNTSFTSPVSKVCVTTEGDAYGIYSNSAGAAFEFPMNVNIADGPTTYKVSKFIGSSQMRPGNSTVALFYDITNKRFVGWNYKEEGDAKRMLFALKDPDNAKFSFQTGMDIVDMESTRFSDGEVFTVLQDASGKRHVYGIYVNGELSNFGQDNVYSDINAENFDTATDYAFHSQTSLMFYCKDNKVYSYNYITNRLTDQLTLDSKETVYKLKFNLYQNMDLTAINNQSEDFMNMQYELIVGSSTGEPDGGIVRFYKVDITTGKLTLHKEYKGFGDRIADVTYRERR